MASRASAAHLVPWPRAHYFCCSRRTQVHPAPSCTPAPPGLLHGPVGRATTPPLPRKLWQAGLARCCQMPPAKREAKLLSAAGHWPAGLIPMNNSTSSAPAWTPGCVCWISTAPFIWFSGGKAPPNMIFCVSQTSGCTFWLLPILHCFFLHDVAHYLLKCKAFSHLSSSLGFLNENTNYGLKTFPLPSPNDTCKKRNISRCLLLIFSSLHIFNT